ncbi:hypothetical protein EW145_g5823 [Phellinidium pouzarii]|uniref:NAD(P)-binding domain-containing protein n=1 Tax=Phellinidium pouzarii TaxID=167371 RepID=A0A4S4KYS0_9AGAM|nr:hypothetical protein EW145_g5823 [Phellinidium pouzarii]
MKVLVVGGSRNIGYFVSQRLLKKGATVTFLLRNKACFDNDQTIQPYIASGQARIVPGDALKEEDHQRAWDVAAEGEGEGVDTVIFTVGGLPKFSLTKGAIIEPPDLCTRCILNLLATFPKPGSGVPPPRLLLVSTMGLGPAAHDALPLAMKPLYSYLLRSPHADKLCMERAIAHVGGLTWSSEDIGEPSAEILPLGWDSRVGPEGWLKSFIVVRPAMLTDGKAKGAYRASGAEIPGAYYISRKDVAHFIVEQALSDWQKWEGKHVRITY